MKFNGNLYLLDTMSINTKLGSGDNDWNTTFFFKVLRLLQLMIALKDISMRKVSEHKTYWVQVKCLSYYLLSFLYHLWHCLKHNESVWYVKLFTTRYFREGFLLPNEEYLKIHNWQRKHLLAWDGKESWHDKMTCESLNMQFSKNSDLRNMQS